MVVPIKKAMEPIAACQPVKQSQPVIESAYDFR